MRDSRKFLEMAQTVLGQGHSLRFQAEGWSMQPTIRYGETVVVEPIAVEPLGAARIRRGDIVLYRWSNGEMFGVRAHRVMRTIAQTSAGAAPVLILRGDACEDNERVPMGDVLGKVVFLERDDRRIRTRGATAFARRVFAGSALQFKRLVPRSIANRWRLRATSVAR